MTKIKGNAAQKAAGQKNAAIESANKELSAIANRYTTQVNKQVGQLQLETTMKAREVVQRVPDADVEPVIKAMGAKRKSEAYAVIGASDGNLEDAAEWFPKNRKPGLQTMARAIKLVQFGTLADTLAAKRYIDKGAKAEWLKATGQEEKTPEPAPTPEPVKDDEPDQKRDVQLPAPKADEVGFIAKVAHLPWEAGEKEMEQYGPEAVKALKALHKMAEKLIEVTANG